MKKQINVKIHKHSSESDLIYRAIANMNEGKKEITPRDLEGYFNTRNAAYASLDCGKLIKGEEPNTYHISEDNGKSYTLTLEWAELYELETENSLP